MTKLSWTVPVVVDEGFKSTVVGTTYIKNTANEYIGKITISKCTNRETLWGWIGVLEYGKEREVFPYGAMCYPHREDYFQSFEEATAFFEKHYDNIVTVCAVHQQNQNFLTHLRGLIKSSREAPKEPTNTSKVN